MENNERLSPGGASQQLTTRQAQTQSALGPFEQPASSYFIEAPDRPQQLGELLDYWRTMMRHKFAIVASSAAGLMLGFLIGIPLKPIFRANTSLEVLNVNEDFMNMRPTEPAVTGADSDNLSEEETQAELLQSAPLLDRVSARLNPNPTLPSRIATTGWRSWLHMHEGAKPSAREKLLTAATSSLKVTNPPRTRILDVSVDSTNPQLALDFTNALVQEFIKQNADARLAATQQTGDWLSREINDARAKLQNSENALQAYAGNARLFFTDEQKQSNVATEKLQEIQQQLSTATSDRIAKQSAYELAKNAPPDSLADVLNDPALQSLSERLADATRQVASLSAVYNPGYSKLQQAQAEVDSLRQAFQSHRADLLHKIETDYQASTRRERLLAAAYDAQAREVAGQDERAVQYNILKREVDSNQQLYDTMLQQMKQASIATALRASNVRLVYPAYLLDRPVFPNFKVNAALGLMAGLICSLGFVFIRERMDRTVKRPGEVRQWVSLPELGTIPRLERKASTWALLPRGTRGRPLPSDDRVLLSGKRPDWQSASDAWDIPAALPEAFHSALTSILRAGEQQGSGRVLVFTSAGPSDGKTSVVSNIAVAAAASGKRVLLVDADLRCPRIHDLFQLPNDAGLADLLRSESDAARWPQVARSTQIPGLSVMTAGRPRRGAGILFYAPHFSTLLAKWRQAYDLVLLDTPPALPITDARVIGFLTDGVVLVARAGQTTRDALSAIQERFAEDRIHVLGCILNDWDPSQSGGAYPYYISEEETIV